MIKFRYRKESSHITGTTLRPVAKVLFESGKEKIEAAMYIDSGADITMIPLELGKALGFKQSAVLKTLSVQLLLKKSDLLLKSSI